MPTPNRAPAGSYLDIRDRYFGPMVLEPYALELARRVSGYNEHPLLEVMADTGILTQMLSAFVHIDSQIVATDTNPENLAHATSKRGLSRVKWDFADPASLNYPDESFGVVSCLFGLAGARNQLDIFREARRILRKSGRFAFCLPDSIAENPVAQAVQDAVDGIFEVDPPRYLTESFHARFDYQTVDDDLTNAGFNDSMFLTLTLPLHAGTPRDAAVAYCLGTPLRLELEQRGNVDEVLDFAEEVIGSRFGAGPIKAKMRGYYVTCAG
jgi:SAM-dependent methyltransferase